MHAWRLTKPYCSMPQVTEMVDGDMAPAAKEPPRFSSRANSSSRLASSSSSTSAAARLANRRGAGSTAAAAARYSRFDAEVSTMQRDSSTYCDEPDDLQDYQGWRAGMFSMEKMQPEIDKLLTGVYVI